MQKLTTIQPSAAPDLSLPYPFHVFEDGRVDRQDFWRGKVFRVIGFQTDIDKMTIDLFWKDAVEDPQRAVGMYVVTANKGGMNATWSVHRSAIGTVRVTELPERYVVEANGIVGEGETLDEAKRNFKRFGGRLADGYTMTYHLGGHNPEVTVKKARTARV